MKINILGTKYTMITRKISEDKTLKENSWGGYCCEDSKTIVIADITEDQYFPYMTDEEKESYRKRTIRHEIVHAFLNESGLSSDTSTPSGGWAKHEEMVDWIAIQFPKMHKAFKKAGAL